MISGFKPYHNVRRRLHPPKMSRSPKQWWLGFFVFLFSLGVFYTRAGTPTHVYAATSSNLNFQARLSASSGTLVPDGTYNVEFKLYNSATVVPTPDQGACTRNSGTPEATCLWTETRTGGSKVTVKNGYFSVKLGEVTALPNINWDQDLWITMNIGGTGAPGWDGEMSPRIKLTAVPYAFNAGQLGGIASTGYAQLGPSSPQVVNLALAALSLNQTGAGGLIQFQNSGNDVFTVANNGNLVSSGNATFSGGTFTLGAATQSGGLVLYDGSSHTGTIQTAALGQNTVFTLPDPGGPTATICLSTGNCAGSGDIRNGGNSFSGLITIGTNDANNLEFETAGITRLTIDQSGNGVFTGSVSGAGLSSSAGLTVSAAGASISGGIDNNSGGITEAGSITGVGTNITASAGLTITSGGSSDLVFDSASNKLSIAANDTSLERIGSGNFSINLSDSGATTLTLNNSSSGAASLNLSDGGLQIAGSEVLTNARLLQNITGISSTGALTSSGGIVSLNHDSNFAANINSGTSSGTVTIGGGSAPLVIDSTNFDVSSGGGLSGITDYAQASGNFVMSGTGTFSTGSGLVSLNGATSISTSANSTVGLTVNGTTGTAATALNIIQTGNAANVTLSNTARTSGALISMTHSTSAFTGTGLLLNFASGSGSFASGNFLDFQVNGATKVKIDNEGALQINSDSAAALVVRNSAGTLSYFTVNTTGSIVQIGASGTGDGTAILFVLDTKNTTGDPSGTDGGSYYNSADAKFRCYENGVWTDCMSSRVMGETTLGGAGATMTVNLASSVEYVHCRIDIKSRSAAAGVYMRFNGDTGAANYSWNEYDIIAAAVGDAQDNSDSEIQLNGTDTGTSPASAEIRITNFADTRKVVDWSWATAEPIGTNTRRYSGAGVWANTSNQITSVTFLTSTGNFGAGSHAWCEGRNVR